MVYLLKMGVYYASMTAVALAVMPYFLLRPGDVENMLLPAAIMRGVARMMGEC